MTTTAQQIAEQERDKLQDKLNEAKSFIASQPQNRILVLQWLGQLTRRRQFLLGKIKDWKAASKKDASDTSFTDYYPEMEEFVEITCMDVIGDLEVISDEQQRKEDLDATAANTRRVGSQDSGSGRNSHNLAVKLPNLEIPSFDGVDTLKWFEFYDIFHTVVDENVNLDDVTKFSYLVSKLKGKASNLIQGLAITGSNYNIALRLLKDEYEDIDHAVESHYMKLIHLPRARNVDELRDVFNQVETHLNCLYALSEDVSQKQYATIIKSKIPQDILVTLNYKHGESSWSVPKLRLELRGYLRAQKRASLVTSISQITCEDDDELFPSTVEGLAVTRSNPKCMYCLQEHWSDQCTKYGTVDSRRTQLNGKYCEICLKMDHDHLACKSDRTCYHCKIAGKHHRSLCPIKFKEDKKSPPKTSSSGLGVLPISESEGEIDPKIVDGLTASKVPVPPSQEVGTTNSEPNAVSSLIVAPRRKVAMQFAQTKVVNQRHGHEISALVFLDSGSGRSYISKQCAEQLRLSPVGSESLCVNTFGTEKQSRVDSPVVQVKVELCDGTFISMYLNVVPVITGRMSASIMDDLDVKLPVPRETLALQVSVGDRPLDILIGNDYYSDIIQERKLFVKEGLYLIQSRLGWILSGRIEDSYSRTSEPCMLLLDSQRNKGEFQFHFPHMDACVVDECSVQDLWALETVGILDPPDVTDDERAMQLFESSVTFQNNRYNVTWPRKFDLIDLPSNFELCLGRLKGVVKKLNDTGKLQDYDNVIVLEEKNGIIERVDPNLPRDGEGLHYTPHHPVITPSKNTTKMRKVHDASAKAKKQGLSLNDCLYRGPVILQDMCSLLMRFRTHKVGMIADIEKAFHQIVLANGEERDLVRFLWLKDISKPVTRDNLCVFRFVRVPFGVISSPFLLAATVEHHLRKVDTPVAKSVRENIYVDNVVFGAESADAAKACYHEAKALFAGASMNLREWISNSEEFNSQLCEADKVICDGQTANVLGVKWDIQSDELKITIPTLDDSEQGSKRVILSAIARIPDLLGFFAPTILLAKLLIQDLWMSSKDWNDPLDEDQNTKWKRICEAIKLIPTVTLPRYILTSEYDGLAYELLIFTDASARAMGIAIYLRVVDSQSDCAIGTNLVFSKARLIPKKCLTIPRAELCAVQLGVKCAVFVENGMRLPIQKRVLWTDSMCVLYWIDNEKQQSRFVENRLRTLRNAKDIEFRYVVSEDNPADVLTKGADPVELTQSGHFTGPKWLQKPSSDWPTWDKPVFPANSRFEAESELAGEVQRSDPEVTAACVADVHQNVVPLNAPWQLDPSKYSSWTKLIRVTAWCSRFVRLMKEKALARREAREPESRGDSILSTGEMNEAKLQWESYVQKDHFKDERAKLSSGGSSEIISKLGLQLDNDGLIRCHHRLGRAQLDPDTIHPKLLPKNHAYTRLIIGHFHQRLFHSKTPHTLSQIRHEYWIPSGRRTVFQTIRDCQICKRHHGGPYSYPDFPQLPISRVNRSHPFKYTGLDYLGPLNIRTNDQNKPVQKVWICLFTCMVFRAIRLELVMDCSSEQFLFALRRFIARNHPSELVMDNATQFKVVKNVLDTSWTEVVKDSHVQSYIANEGIEWKFIVANAPWSGGFYERLVAIVKNALRKAVGRVALTRCQLETLLVEVESVVNTRPLVYVGADLGSGVALTPQHFISGNWQTGVPVLDSENADDYEPDQNLDTAALLLKSWKKGQRYLNAIWNIFRDEYLLSLRERFDKSLKQDRIRADFVAKVGDVVLVVEDKVPRGSWKMGRISSIIVSSDGKIRSVLVELPGPRKSVISRPVNKLCPLETSNKFLGHFDEPDETKHFDQKLVTTDTEPEAPAQPVLSARPKRNAAEKARTLFQQLDE